MARERQNIAYTVHDGIPTHAFVCGVLSPAGAVLSKHPPASMGGNVGLPSPPPAAPATSYRGRSRIASVPVDTVYEAEAVR